MFVYDGNSVVAEYEDNTLNKKYLWGEDVSGSMAGAGGVGALLVVNDTTEDYYSMYDGNGNIVKYVDETSNEVESIEQPFKFSSEYHDTETGLIYYNYRYYDPENGKWKTHDPIAEQGGLNLYGFVNNKPVNNIDLLGLSGFSVFGHAFGVSNSGAAGAYAAAMAEEAQLQMYANAKAVGDSTLEEHYKWQTILVPKKNLRGATEWVRHRVNYEVYSQIYYTIEIAGMNTKGEFDSGTLVSNFPGPVGWMLPGAFNKYQLKELHVYRCRKRYKCKQKCSTCCNNVAFEYDVEDTGNDKIYVEGHLAPYPLQGYPYCKVTEEAKNKVIKEKCPKDKDQWCKNRYK
ncbi:RHS repeat-associated core domain-containing protein [Lentisphaerota bacterium WC36G]|nr:RHS repeat-associated core domain-containing protein [Lentisphaerae bacterium WC36]